MRFIKYIFLCIYCIIMAQKSYCSEVDDAIINLSKAETVEQFHRQVDNIPDKTLNIILNFFATEVTKEIEFYTEKKHLNGIITQYEASPSIIMNNIKTFYYRGKLYTAELKNLNINEDFKEINKKLIERLQKKFNNDKNINKKTLNSFIKGLENPYDKNWNLLIERIELMRQRVFSEFLVIKCLYNTGSQEQCQKEFNDLMAFEIEINKNAIEIRKSSNEHLTNIKSQNK